MTQTKAEFEKTLDKILPVMTQEQQAEALASFCTPEAHAAFVAECEARELRDKAIADDLWNRGMKGERLVIHPCYLSLLIGNWDAEPIEQISWASNWWAGFNGSRCFIANAFSLQMLDGGYHEVHISPIPESILPDKRYMESFVGHPDTAAVLGVPYNRGSLRLRKGDILFVAQIISKGRLPEGATKLPEGFSIQWYSITID